MTNEFEEFAAGDDETQTPFVKGAESSADDLISKGDQGVAYDWSKAPDVSKAPPRVNLDGQTKIISKMEITLPPMSREWSKTKDGKNEYKYCKFTVFFDGGQQEDYSGMRVFKRDGNKYSEPTFPRDGMSQVSKLLCTYAKFKKIDPNEVKLREFYLFLNTKPKAKIVSETVRNPKTNETFKKNMIVEFVA